MDIRIPVERTLTHHDHAWLARLRGLRVVETARWGSAAGRPGAARILSVPFQPEAHAQEGA